MNEKIFLTVIIPAYDEENNIKSTLEEVADYLNKKAFAYEIMVVDDGSRDDTAEVAKKASSIFSNFRIIKNKSNKGKGFSVKRAMLEAKGDYALFMDADNSTSIYEFDKFLPYIKEGYDVVISSRRLKESIVEEPQPLLRAKMGAVYIFLSKFIFKLDVKDFNCGFKAYNTKHTRHIFEAQKMYDWSFDVELLFLANKYYLKLKEVPVRWIHKSGSKVKPIKDAIKSFISILKIKMNDVAHGYQ